MLTSSGRISLVDIQNELYSKLPTEVLNGAGSVGSYYNGIISPNNTEKGTEAKAIKVTTVNNAYHDGFITYNNGQLANGVSYILSYEVWVPSGHSISVGIRQQSGGGGYFAQTHAGNSQWRYIFREFVANTNTSSMIHGYQYGGAVTDVFSFYIRNMCIIQKGAIDLNNSIRRKLASKTSGAISFSDFYNKEGQFWYSKNYTHSYPWTPPSTQYFNGTLSSTTTTGNYQGALSLSGAKWNSYGSYALYGSEVLYQSNTGTPTAVGTQIGATWISGTYEYKWVVNRWVTKSIVNYIQQYDTYKTQQRRLITVYQNYQGTVYLRG